MTKTHTEEKNLFAELKDYFQVRFDLIKIEFIERSSSLISRLITTVVVAFLSIFIFLFLSIGLALYLGGMAAHASSGFFIVAGIFVILLVVLRLIRKPAIEKPLINYQIKRFFHQKI